MNKLETFNSMLIDGSNKVPLLSFLMNACLVLVLAVLLGMIYQRYSKSFSNRKAFSRNFPLLAFATMLIIMIVKSSLALSLGLVGALSIVRFRSAIKEPEELVYLFLVIALGLGLGADQTLITLVGFIITAGFIIIRSTFFDSPIQDENLVLTISSPEKETFELDSVLSILKNKAKMLELVRYSDNDGVVISSFRIDFTKIEDFNSTLDELKKSLPGSNIQFVKNRAT